MPTTVNDAIVRKKYTTTSTAPSSRNMSLPPLSLWYRHVHVHVRIRSSEQKDSGSSVKNSSIHTQNSHYFTEFWKINHNETEGSTYILLFVYYCKAANTEIEYIVHSSYLPLVMHCKYNHTNTSSPPHNSKHPFIFGEHVSEPTLQHPISACFNF